MCLVAAQGNGNKNNYLTENQNTIQKLETAQAGSCSITLDKPVVNVGDEAGGIIRDGANTLCEIYASDGTVWHNVGEGTTNANGDLRYSDTIYVPGTFEFRAICGSCVTNIVYLKVNELPPDPTDEPEPDEGLQPGDIIQTEEGSYLISNDNLHFEINLVGEPGDVDICAEIERSSYKANPECNPSGDLEDWAEFVLLDSYGVVWERNDPIFSGATGGPDTFGNPDVVNVRWDGQIPFKVHMSHYGPCPMNMRTKVTLVVCE